uniref:THD domain-containing protein n=1 Tax=Suricata suricatta TaxID=37032 RepID=A0A673TRI4_SURSU
LPENLSFLPHPRGTPSSPGGPGGHLSSLPNREVLPSETPGLGHRLSRQLWVRLRARESVGLWACADPRDPRFPGGCGRGRGSRRSTFRLCSPQAVFAQLVAQDVQLTEGPLRWYSNPGLAGVFLGPGLSYNQHTRELMVAEPGIYYVFLNLKVQRVVSGASGPCSVSVALHLQPLGAAAAALALTLDLPPSSSDSASGSRGSLLHLGAGQRLGVHLRTQGGPHPAWQLAQGATILGLFRVSTRVPAGFALPPWPIDTGPGPLPLDGE